MINKVIITGRMVRDAELRSTLNGKSVASFTVANDTGFGDYKRTNFINVVAWGKTAEVVANHFRKGTAIGIVGEIQTRDYEKDGHKVYVTEVMANEVHFIESKKEQTESPADLSQMEGFAPMENDGDLPF